MQKLDVPGALGRRGLLNRLDLLGLGLGLSGLGGGSGLGGLSLGLNSGGGLSDSLSGGRDLSWGSSSISRLGDRSLLLLLGLLLVLLATQERAKDGSALPARGALALLSLGLLGLFLGLLLGGLSDSSGRSLLSSLRGGGSLLNSLGGLLDLLVLNLLLLGLLLLLSRSERSQSGLVLLGLGDGLRDFLGLGYLDLELSDPVVTLGLVGSLESVLVALGGQDELVGAISGRLSSISLEKRGLLDYYYM